MAEQQRFYETHLKPGVARFFAALAAAKHANFYRQVAAVGGAFTALETESFQLD